MPGAEAATGAGQQDRTNISVGLDRIERTADLFVHLDVEAVEPVGPVERDRRQALMTGKFDRFKGHGAAFRSETGRNGRVTGGE